MNTKEKILHLLYISAFRMKKVFTQFLAEYNLSEMEAKFLYHIGSKETHKTCDLIDFFKKHKSTIRQKTKGLEEKGYLVSEQCVEDKRERVVHLTEKGQEFFLKIKKLRETHDTKIFKNFTKEEEQQLYYLLEKLDTK